MPISRAQKLLERAGDAISPPAISSPARGDYVFTRKGAEHWKNQRPEVRRAAQIARRQERTQATIKRKSMTPSLTRLRRSQRNRR